MIVVSGNFFEAMNKVSGIASDLKFSLSGVGSPSVFIESLMIGGEA
jgi:PmbA protein